MTEIPLHLNTLVALNFLSFRGTHLELLKDDGIIYIHCKVLRIRRVTAQGDGEAYFRVSLPEN